MLTKLKKISSPNRLPSLLLRLQKAQKKLKDLDIAACVISNPLEIYYLTEMHFSKATLLIGQKTALLLVDKRYIQVAQEKAPIKAHLYNEEEIISFFAQKNISSLAFDSEYISYSQYRFWRALQGKTKKTGKSSFRLIPIPNLLYDIRSIKDACELEYLRKSAQINWEGFQYIKSLLSPKITERELSVAFEIFCKQQGADGLAFEPIIAFGKNTAMPHYQPQDILFKKKDIVLLDLGVTYNGYCSDMTRVLFTEQSDVILKKMYRAVKKAHKSALHMCKPGASIAEIDYAAKKVIQKEKMAQYCLHSLGHGVGLQIHEFPEVKIKGKQRFLESNMVITIEPGLYLPSKGGVRYEDTIIITQDGYENLYPEGEEI